MKHFVIYALAAVLLFSMVGRFAAVETSSAAERTDAPVAAMASLPEEDGGAQEELLVGLLQANMGSMDDMYFRSALEEGLGEGFSLHCLSTADVGREQSAMFQKLVEKGYRLLVVELFDTELADEYIDLAQEKGLTLIFTGMRPSDEQMARMEKVYYVGFSAGNTMRELADAIILGWNNNQSVLDNKADGRLIYGVFTSDDYEANGNQEALDRYLAAADIESEMGLNPITQAFSFNLKKEVDNILYAGGELIICDSSSYARQISDYLHDPEEFSGGYEWLSNTRLFLTVADESAQKMVEEGTAMFATGANGGDIGGTVARLAQALSRGEKPSAENVGIAPDQHKCFYVHNRTVLADLLQQPAPEEAEEDTEES